MMTVVRLRKSNEETFCSDAFGARAQLNIKSPTRKSTRHGLSPSSLDDVAKVLAQALPSNYPTSSATATYCPDLGGAPFQMACENLSGSEIAADNGGQGNLFPQPRLNR